ncbi:hypothetical protein COJ85_10615 [Bacillus sp. AFS076308]|uniref:GNAT family N-acetyltransferase n=1 Tax=unclassified Bacillus (in: firmicutes) TaxID=185979 RepID=UPI000BF79E87|nr:MULTISPECIES: GNAT family N-acetyltransferase [unclassified Bacillus (in: firmicutes)]PFO04944.1 hypothetical protein COJ85_10615 [Bacillus sp. AFS076308]PGV51041.1 hypothetical protein COD92_15720 [Bacillus sp. AFS037270]
MEIRIEPFKNKDVKIIPKLIETGMDKDIFPLTIFSSNGYEAYLRKQLKISEKNRRAKFYAAFIDDELAGYSEWRYLENSLLLNNIYVSPEYRGVGIGKFLLVKHGAQLLAEYKKSIISLDVFENNTAAMSWYKKMGFVIEDTTSWYVGEQSFFPDTNSSNECFIENYPNAEAEHKLFGFSMLTCKTRNGVYQIGRIKSQFYRLTSTNSLHDYDLLHCLYQLDPTRKLLLLTSGEISSRIPFKIACKSSRMNLKI